MASAGAGHGIARSEEQQIKHTQQQQESRRSQTEPQETRKMTAPQSAMRTKPDCGEQSYKGANKLRGKAAVITGGDSGIGRAVAIAFAREGASVAINFHTHKEDVEDTLRIVKESGAQGFIMQADVSKRSEAFALVQRAVESFGHLDVVVCNAAVQETEEDFANSDEAMMRSIFDTNYFGSVFITQAALPHLKAGGCVLFNTSINAYVGNRQLVTYTATKGAMTGLMRSLALQLGEKQIRVNAVAPGPVWTPFITGTFDDERIRSFGEKTLLGRAGEPVEVAPAFVFLASTDSSFMTGTTIHVDGGQYTSS
jgi:NAD(P)-dependent dehydrogenase (short-subunit alcohol dehydrogenase family)